MKGQDGGIWEEPKGFFYFTFDVLFELPLLVLETLLLLNGMRFEERPCKFPLPLVEPVPESSALAMVMLHGFDVNFFVEEVPQLAPLIFFGEGL